LNSGHQVTVLAPLGSNAADLKLLGCRLVPLEMDAKGLGPVKNYRLIRKFKSIFKKENPDIILSYTIKNNIFGAFAARSYGIPFIPNVTGLGTAFLSGGVLQRIAEILYRKAFRGLSIIFFQNTDDRDLFIDHNLIKLEQAQTLPGSGIDLKHFKAEAYPETQDEVRFLLIARLLRDKGIYEFIDAARQVKARGGKASFQLLGAADTENRTAIRRATVAEWEAEGVVEYLGTASDVRPYIKNSHCVVLPSYREGTPRTLLEAASMARPLIATDVPGCRSVVDQNVTGFLCDAHSGDSLAVAVQKFLDLPREVRIEMGRAGRAKMEHEFDNAIVARMYYDAIENLTEKK